MITYLIYLKTGLHLLKKTHEHSTRHSVNGTIVIQRYNTKNFGRFSFINTAINCWNFLQKQLKEKIFYKLKTNRLKLLLKEFYLQSYLENN